MADTLPPAQQCCTDCADPVVTSVPGAAGVDGADGADGVDGLNAFSLIDGTVPVAVPAFSAAATIELRDPPGSQWMGIDQVVFISPYGYYRVTALPTTTSATVLNLGDGTLYPDNINGVGNFADNSKVSPGGVTGPAGAAGAGGAPDDATYILQTADAGLTSAQDLASLATGLMKSTTGTGVVSTVPVGILASNFAPVDSGAALTAGQAVFALAGGLESKTAANARTALGFAATAIGTQLKNAVDFTGGTIIGITDLAVADGGTAASTASGARTNLGVHRTPQDIIILREQQVSGTDGGTFTNGAWRTRVLNTEVCDTGGHCSLAANQFTLANGVYRIHAMAPGHKVDHHQIRLYDVVAASVVIESGISAYGTNVDSDNAGDHATMAQLEFRFTVSAGPRAYEIQHQCQTTRNTDGLGHAGSFGLEVYTQVRLEREVG